MPKATRNRFKVGFKSKMYVNGKVDPTQTVVYQSFVDAHRVK